MVTSPINEPPKIIARRRVSTAAQPGVDTEPQKPAKEFGERQAEDMDGSWQGQTESNDERLRAEKPPHWS